MSSSPNFFYQKYAVSHTFILLFLTSNKIGFSTLFLPHSWQLCIQQDCICIHIDAPYLMIYKILHVVNISIYFMWLSFFKNSLNDSEKNLWKNHTKHDKGVKINHPHVPLTEVFNGLAQQHVVPAYKGGSWPGFNLTMSHISPPSQANTWTECISSTSLPGLDKNISVHSI